MKPETPHAADVMASRSAFAVRPADKDEPRAYLAPSYTLLVPILTKAARECGYALGLHGSMARDLDLIAVPWIEDATDADTLVARLVEACGGFLREERAQRDPVARPHGRLAWSIHLGGGPYIDLSVMPREDIRSVRLGPSKIWK